MKLKTAASKSACLAAALFCTVYAACLLAFPAEMSTGVREGLSLCGETLIPSLLPFLILSGFFSLSGPARAAEKLFGPVVKRLFHLPGCAAIPVLMGTLGGYPVAARSAAVLMKNGALSARDVQRLLCFCVNAGPAFLVGAVGAGMFHSPGIGMLLLASQMISSLVIGVFLGFGQRPEKGKADVKTLPYSQALVSAVEQGVSGMLGICGFVLLFSSLTALWKVIGVPELLADRFPQADQNALFSLYTGFWEVTTGCREAVKANGITGVFLAAFLVSFSGVSVLFQVISLFPAKTVSFRPFVLSRLFHGLLTCAFAAVLLCLSPQSAEVFLPAGGSSPAVVSHSPLLSCVMLLLCASVLTGSGLKKGAFSRRLYLQTGRRF